MVLIPTDEAKFPTSGKSYTFRRDLELGQAPVTRKDVTLNFTVAWAVPDFHRTSFAASVKRYEYRQKVARHPKLKLKTES